MIKLMYITKMPEIASMAEKAGVNMIFVDLEKLGKHERQAGVNSVKSDHCINDVCIVRKVISKSSLLVRVNPINPQSEQEIKEVIDAGADIIMLPMWRSVEDVETFLKFVGGKTKTMLLLETREADECLDDVLTLGGFDSIHIGLNDLHLSYKKKFLFELLSDGTVERICTKIGEKKIPFGFGGIGRIGHGTIPAEHILCEHCRLGSEMVILSRSFCNITDESKVTDIEKIFFDGIKDIRNCENEYKQYTKEMFWANKNKLKAEVERNVENIS